MRSYAPPPRVRIRPLDDAEFAQVHAWFVAADPRRLTCRPIPVLDTDSARGRLQERLARQACGVFAVLRVDDDVLVGRVSWFDFNPRNGAVEIGYLLGPAFRGHGYAREAVQLLIGFLREEIGARKATAQTAAFNRRSVELLEALGFHQDGRLRQHHELDGELHDDLLYSRLLT